MLTQDNLKDISSKDDIMYIFTFTSNPITKNKKGKTKENTDNMMVFMFNKAPNLIVHEGKFKTRRYNCFVNCSTRCTRLITASQLRKFRTRHSNILQRSQNSIHHQIDMEWQYLYDDTVKEARLRPSSRFGIFKTLKDVRREQLLTCHYGLEHLLLPVKRINQLKHIFKSMHDSRNTSNTMHEKHS